MAHFAKLNENNYVTSVHVVDNSVLLDSGVESEEKGINFLAKLHGHLNWKQTSYNSSFRKSYAGVGFYYDAIRDAFIEPKPFDDWILNEDTCKWEPPIPMPNDGNYYLWNEIDHQWLQMASLEEMSLYISQLSKEE
jgi:hypothetical protein